MLRPLRFIRLKNCCTNTILVKQWGIIPVQRKTACRFAKGGLSKEGNPLFFACLRTPPIARILSLFDALRFQKVQ